MGLKRRELLILVSIWLVGCTLTGGLLALFYLNTTPPPPGESVQPEVEATITIPFTDTAKSVYLLALAEAQNWHHDVSLVGLSAHWSAATIDTLNQTEIWDFRFFSPERRRIFLVNVTSTKEVSGQAHLYKVRLTNKPSIINPDDWLVDSNQAILTWLNQGGGFFLETFPESQVQVIFRQPPSKSGPIWEIIAITADQSNFFYLAIDAVDGDIIE